jgi:hypothetical protein
MLTSAAVVGPPWPSRELRWIRPAGPKGDDPGRRPQQLHPLPRTVGLGVVNSRQLHICAGERCPCRSVSLFCASLRLRSQRQGLRAPPAFRVCCNGSCGPSRTPAPYFHSLDERLAVGVSRRQSGWQVWDGEKRPSVCGQRRRLPKSLGRPPTHGVQKTYLKLRLCVELHSSILLSDLTTRLPYDRRLRRQLDSSRDQ